jgi:hypothetical protein
MKQTKIMMVIIAVLVAGLVTMSILCRSQKKHVSTLKMQVKEQSAIIDSLLNRRMTVFDVRLNVTDKSKSTIYGRYNKGTINMPQEKTYKLEIDSTNIAIKQ